MSIKFRRKIIFLILLLVILAIALSACEPLDTFGDVLTGLANSLMSMVDAMVKSIRFPSFR